MPTESAWGDPRTWTAIGSLAVGFVGLLYGVLSGKWNRHESRLDALSKILEPMVKAAQEMMLANNCRRRCEQLKFSFPNPNLTPEAVHRVNGLVEEYGEHLKIAQQEFRAAEAQLASCSFRFPDKVTRLVKRAHESLAQFGRLVNDGNFDKADLQLAKFRDDYSQITREGRGWRLADPLEGLLRHFRRKKEGEPEADKYELTEKAMEDIMSLVHKRATTQANNTFAVHPPRKLLERPETAKADNVIEELEDSVFVVAFQDGTARMMTLVELMVFTYNLIALAHSGMEVAQMMQAVPSSGPCEVSVKFTMSMDEVMRPAMVRALLEKIEFSKEPSDPESEKEGVAA
jgi:hypothetical protein